MDEPQFGEVTVRLVSVDDDDLVVEFTVDLDYPGEGDSMCMAGKALQLCSACLAELEEWGDGVSIDTLLDLPPPPPGWRIEAPTINRQ